MRLYSYTHLVGAAALSALAVASPLHHGRAFDTTTIQWTPCDIPNATLPLECGNLTVPLDYTDTKSNATLRLDLLRAPASKKCDKKRSILLNFGGPGADGVADFALFAERMQAATGGSHDLISFAPRGTGLTLPFSCYPNDISRQVGAQPLAGNASDVALGQIWAKSTLFASNCFAAQNKTGQLIGTAFVVRDMMRIVDALREDGMLRYWGVSYGTVLGATAVAMFPDKMDRVVLDGVVNPFEYYTNTESELFTDLDATFRGFIEGCVAAREACPLAGNLTADELHAAVYKFLDNLKYNPIPLPSPALLGGGSLIDISIVKTMLLPAFNFPTNWASTAATLHPLMTGNITAIAAVMSSSGSAGSASASNQIPSSAEALQGIKCSDVRQHTSNLTAMLPVFAARHNMSRMFGDTADEMVARCAQWRMPAKERYMGDFNVTSRNPVLVIGNTHDPTTPLASARNVSETFAGSVLLQHDSYGHDSLMMGSLCTARAIRSYFLNGTMPAKGTVCPVKAKLFTGESGWDTVLKELKQD
ncbi:hypothetical protein PLICBS_008999 [Purpureocillium lilacinum]|uniref:uncharacterized protein n=1 Tax=Purpureocillium lilacinum TaxID=33203 RepID=UPI00208C1894|nr:hypothetical protein PLICBS_008999 [Purpureocillium lilacinum]